MRIELPDDLIAVIQSHAEQEGRGIEETVAELLRKGLDHSMLERRKQIGEKFLKGEWGADLDGFEKGRIADRTSAADHDRAWKG